MKKNIIDKKNYDKLVINGALEIESYCDIVNKSAYDDKDFIEFFDMVKKYYDLSKEKVKQRDKIVEKLSLLIEKIGEDNFDIDNDGNISFIMNNN